MRLENLYTGEVGLLWGCRSWYHGRTTAGTMVGTVVMAGTVAMAVKEPRAMVRVPTPIRTLAKGNGGFLAGSIPLIRFFIFESGKNKKRDIAPTKTNVIGPANIQNCPTVWIVFW